MKRSKRNEGEERFNAESAEYAEIRCTKDIFSGYYLFLDVPRVLCV